MNVSELNKWIERYEALLLQDEKEYLKKKAKIQAYLVDLREQLKKK
jgi:hypothetical protein